MPWSTWIDLMGRGAADLGRMWPWFLLAIGAALELVGLRVLVGRPAAMTVAVEPVRTAALALPAFDPSIRLPSWMPSLLAPLACVGVPEVPDLLPGAERGYRGGIHLGVDFPCAPGTPVRAVRTGFVLSVERRADLPMTKRDELLRHCRELGRTPEVMLTVLHGKRVVLCHGITGGRLLTSSYSHLGAIRGDLTEGTPVAPGEIIAWTGSSGTSHAYAGDGWAELHFELAVDGLPLGLGLSPREAGALYAAAFVQEQ